MTEIPFQMLFSAFFFLFFPLIGGYVAVRFRLSPLVGYILGGILLHLLWGDRLPHEFINSFSMLGLVLLIFTIGLETNFASIRRFGKFVILGGTLQMGFTALILYLISLIFGFTLIESVFIGFAFSLSSTAVVSKIIQERGEENSLLGGLAIGVLIFQDIVFIPLLIILSSFGKDRTTSDVIIQIALNTGKAAVVLSVVYYVGQKIVPYVFNKIAKKSREILNLYIIVFIIAALAFFSLLGMSSLLAAFVAGVLLGQTIEHYHIFSQIRPLRDLLAVVFFVFLGLTINLSFVLGNIVPILLFLILVILIKSFIILIVYLFFKFHSRTSFSLGLFLFQIGEGAFVLIFLGFTNGQIREEIFHFALSVVLLSLLITPIVLYNKDKIYFFLRNMIKKYLPFVEKFVISRLDREPPSLDILPLKDHVIICGYGRVGRYIGRAFMLSNIPFIAIDYNFHTVETVKKEGITILYGDPTEIDVLDYAQCERANILISAVPVSFSQEMIVLNAKKLNPKIIIFTRVHQEIQQRRMKDLGVEVIVQPEFEAALSIVRRIMYRKGLDKEEIARRIKRLKIEHGMI